MSGMFGSAFIPAGATGSIQFTSNGLFAGSSNLFWDNTNSRLGVGTNVPATPLQVASSDTLLATFQSTANQSPTIKLQGTDRSVTLTCQPSALAAPAYWLTKTGISATNDALLLQDTPGTTNYSSLGVNNSQDTVLTQKISGRYILFSGGSVGINEPSPGAQLQVTSASAATKGLLIKGNTSQSANYFEVQDSFGSVKVYVDSYGQLISASALNAAGSGLRVSAITDNGIGNGITANITTASGGFKITARDAGNTPLLVLTPFTGYMQNLQEWRNSSSIMLSAIDSNGVLLQSTIKTNAASGKAGMATTDSYLEFQDASGINYANFRNDGQLRLFKGASLSGYKLQLYSGSGIEFIANVPIAYTGASSPTLVPNATNFTLNTVTASNNGLIVQGVASQSANLQEWRNNSGTVLASVDPSGNFNATTIRLGPVGGSVPALSLSGGTVQLGNSPSASQIELYSGSTLIAYTQNAKFNLTKDIISAAAADFNIFAKSNGAGTDNAGYNLILNAGYGTGASTPASILFQVASKLVSGSTPQSLTSVGCFLGDKGYFGSGTIAPTSQIDANGVNGYAQLRLRNTYTPTSTADANGNVGDTAWDANYIYIKTGSGWKRSALSTF